MAIKNKNCANPTQGTITWGIADFLKDVIDFSMPVAPAASATNQVFGRYSPGFPFQVLGVRLYGTSFTNVTSVDCGLAPTAGGTYTSMLTTQITPSPDTEVVGTLLTATLSLPSLYTRNATGQIIVKYTTGTTPAAVNAFISVLIRPHGVDQEVP